MKRQFKEVFSTAFILGYHKHGLRKKKKTKNKIFNKKGETRIKTKSNELFTSRGTDLGQK